MGLLVNAPFPALAQTPLCFPGYQPAPCGERLESVFAEAFDDDTIYAPWACQNNVEGLLGRLHAAGFRLRRFRVLYLIAVEPDGSGGIRATGSQIHPLNARDESTAWAFHVVLEAGGQVIDLDFGGSPRILPWAEYREAMFGVVPKPAMGVRAIPAWQYLREHSEVIDLDHLPAKNWTYYVYDTDKRYPVAPLAEFR